MRGLALMIGAAVALASASASAMELSSPDMAPGAALALNRVYSQCGGGNVSPALAWSGAPAGAQSFAVTVYDPDAQGGWWHWIVYDIPASASGLPEGAGGGQLPQGAQMGRNDFGDRAYDGPCPPPGSGVHHYEFTLWALPTPNLSLDGSPRGAVIGPYLQAHALGRATLTGVYER